jgi:hypothetical protein
MRDDTLMPLLRCAMRCYATLPLMTLMLPLLLLCRAIDFDTLPPRRRFFIAASATPLTLPPAADRRREAAA